LPSSCRSTDAAGNIVFQGYDLVKFNKSFTGHEPLTGVYNARSRTYSFNTNQPPFMYINTVRRGCICGSVTNDAVQWSADKNGNWEPGMLMSLAALTAF
jgi:hypothetical protein